MATTRLVTAVFRDPSAVEQALDYLSECGHDRDTINVLSAAQPDPKGGPRVRRGNRALQGMGLGGVIGMLVGAATLAPLAIGTSVLVPVTGMLIDGTILAAVVGAGLGAIAGHALGFAVGLVIPARGGLEAACQQALSGGGTALIVRPHNALEAGHIEHRFRQLQGENVACLC